MLLFIFGLFTSGIVDITTNHFCSPNKCQECDMLMHLNLNARITCLRSATFCMSCVCLALCVLPCPLCGVGSG